jgi:hypothetical protein
MEPRVADKRDVPRITEVLLAALPQDPFYQYLWQHRKAYPNDHKFYWEHRMQCDIFNPRYAFMVLELKSQRADKTCEWVSAQGTPIISFAIFERIGDSNKALEWEYKRMTGPKGVNRLFYRFSLVIFTSIFALVASSERRKIYGVKNSQSPLTPKLTIFSHSP